MDLSCLRVIGLPRLSIPPTFVVSIKILVFYLSSRICEHKVIHNIILICSHFYGLRYHRSLNKGLYHFYVINFFVSTVYRHPTNWYYVLFFFKLKYFIIFSWFILLSMSYFKCVYIFLIFKILGYSRYLSVIEFVWFHCSQRFL